MIHVHAKFDSRTYHKRHISRHEPSLTVPVIYIYRIMLDFETEFHEKGGGGAGMRMTRGMSMVL